MSKEKPDHNVLKLMQEYCNLDIIRKSEVMTYLKSQLLWRPMSFKEALTIESLLDWCGVNMIVGDEKCPPTLDALNDFINTRNKIKLQ